MDDPKTALLKQISDFLKRAEPLGIPESELQNLSLCFEDAKDWDSLLGRISEYTQSINVTIDPLEYSDQEDFDSSPDVPPKELKELPNGLLEVEVRPGDGFTLFSLVIKTPSSPTVSLMEDICSTIRTDLPNMSTEAHTNRDALNSGGLPIPRTIH